MASTKRGYIFGAFAFSLIGILFVIISVSSTAWIVATGVFEVQVSKSTLQYGLFSGEVTLNILGTPSKNTLYMTCVPSVGACAVSCKTNENARVQEVEALVKGFAPNEACVPTTIVDTTRVVFDDPPVISFAFYVSLQVLVFLLLLLTVACAGLAILNAVHNPTEPLLSLPGCLYCNIFTAIVGLVVLLLGGIYYTVTEWHEHLAFSYVSLNLLTAWPGLGYSYWVLIIPVVCSLANVGLIWYRRYLLEKDPPPPTIKVDNHSRGTEILY